MSVTPPDEEHERGAVPSVASTMETIPAAADSEPRAPAPSLADVDEERRRGRIAAAAGFASVALTIGALVISASAATRTGVDERDDDDRRRLLDLVSGETEQLLSACGRAAGLLVLVLVARYFFAVIRARNPRHPRFIPVIGVVAFVLVAATTLVSFLEFRDVAQTFAESGPQTAERASALIDDARDDGLLRLVNVLSVLGALVFGIWVSLLSYEAMQVGLVARFIGIIGIGTGVTSVAAVVELSTTLFLGWMICLSLLAAGWWPRGRPPAWEEGRAVPWNEVDVRESPSRGRMQR